MSKRVTRGWLVRAGIASAVGAAAIFAAVTLGAFGGTNASAAGLMTMTLVGGGNQPIGGTFTVDNAATNPGNATWAGYSMQIAYNPSIVSVVSTVSDNIGPGCTGGAWANPQNSPTVLTGCFGQVSTGTGNTDTVTFQCIAPGSTGLHLITLVEDPVNGSQFFDGDAATIPTDLTDTSVNCTLPISKSHSPAGNQVAGTTVTYTVHVGNPTATSSPGHNIFDAVPAPLTNVTLVSSTNGALDGCSVAANTLTCSSATIQPDPTGFDVVFTADIPLSAAGTNGICNQAKLDGGSALSNNDCFDVAPATLVVTKSVIGGPTFKAGDPISWTVTVANTGGSPADTVVVTDTATDGFDITGSTGSANCTANPTTTTTASFACGNLTSGDGVQTLTITGTVHDPNPTDLTCNNDVSATANNAATASQSASASCVSKNVRMVKDTDGNLDESSELANLWLCKGANCVNNGEGSLVVNEWALNYSGDPQGLGAYEFQVKYDNHIFDISIADSGLLYSTGRVPGDTGIGGCSATIITENDIRFGCVSKNPQPLAPQTGCLGPDNTTVVQEAICGVKADGILATITVTPKADLVNRITPGNDNGAIRSLLDEGCELADIWGHPLSAAPDASGVDALGREIPLGGIAPGGQVTDCADITITVRVLEGDMNVDCVVDVTDDQTEASHYGAFFGNLLYQPWYDLEPALKDGDVDIKDLQKVFGRNGSTCSNPVPPQPALPEPVDP
jgi:uncharacterized repeat protein (TIGR01451 family)